MITSIHLRGSKGAMSTCSHSRHSDFGNGFAIERRRLSPSAMLGAEPWLALESLACRMREKGTGPDREEWYPMTHIRHALYLVFAALIIAISGCSTNSPQYQTRPFFLAEEDTATHGRKSWFDRIIETDPGVTDFVVATDYQEHPSRRIAVLPFVDHGTGEYTVDKIPLRAFRPHPRSE